MKTKAEVLPVSVDEAEAIAGIVRRADREELECLGITDMVAGLRLCFGGSLRASKIVHAGLVLAVVGDAIHDSQQGIGIPWMITTVHVELFPRPFLRACPGIVADMLTRHRVLANFVDVRNAQAIRWLKWLGFRFEEAMPYGLAGQRFYPFTLNKEV